jgi:hypothetical protein
MESIEKLLFPDAYKIVKNYDNDNYLLSYSFLIVDDELDPYEVEVFYNEIQIKTDGYTFISLSASNLKFLLKAQNKLLKELKIDDR